MIILVILRIYLVAMIVIKSYMHTYIADKHGTNLGGGGGLSFRTLWFYNMPVADEYKLLKKSCNWLQVHNVILLVVVVFLSLIF